MAGAPSIILQRSNLWHCIADKSLQVAVHSGSAREGKTQTLVSIELTENLAEGSRSCTLFIEDTDSTSGIEIHPMVIGVGAIFAMVQLVLVFRHSMRCSAMNSLIDALEKTEQTGLPDMLATKHARRIQWVCWVVKTASLKHGRPANVVERLDGELNESVALISRRGELAPLLVLRL